MKKTISVAMLSSALVISGCASTGGLATSANGGCNTGMSTAVGALLGAAIGASVGDSSYAATGAAIGGAVFAAGCLMINAHTIQKKSAAEVETAYKKANKGKLLQTTRVQQYSTVILPNQTVAANQIISVTSDLTSLRVFANTLQRDQEKLVLTEAMRKMIRKLVTDVEVLTAKRYNSGDFENSFIW